jgi:YVTN family beta-propeller protein
MIVDGLPGEAAQVVELRARTPAGTPPRSGRSALAVRGAQAENAACPIGSVHGGSSMNTRLLAKFLVSTAGAIALSGSGVLVATSAAPAAAAAAGCAGKAYVINFEDGTVSVIETATGKVSDTIAVGTHPVDVAITPDGKHAYVTNYGARTVDGAVSVIDTTTGKVSDTITVGADPFAVAICPARTARTRP